MLIEVDYIYSLDHTVLFLPSQAPHLVYDSLTDNNTYLRFAFRMVEMALTETVQKEVRVSLFPVVPHTMSRSGLSAITWHRSYRKLSPPDLLTFCADFAPVLVVASTQGNKQPWIHAPC